eukprot:CAMPEP_0175918274 /NCGR_PEP_ID=MMETSP0108-20121206/11795_1 /TAXON_ID=195067 ORGANISM="Goniomonas pacifica, Strain CCMP1869" /NCGR_SAMPLE_ID=MMETSP0108 /ASSEMBLY_ACC=CAM_ASM_000204 /LENGTH=99 /DNA_ID=CAMNT_0017240887 /DNA_START=263 /DNA_END=559 /DNA_ORIENTATION=+
MAFNGDIIGLEIDRRISAHGKLLLSIGLHSTSKYSRIEPLTELPGLDEQRRSELHRHLVCSTAPPFVCFVSERHPCSMLLDRQDVSRFLERKSAARPDN